MQLSLLDPLEVKAGWRLPELPNLTFERDLWADTETTGLRWFAKDTLVGMSICTVDRRTWYLPCGHRGENYSPENLLAWAKDNLRNKNIRFFNAPFDVNMFYNWGLDLEELDTTVSDISLWGSLLDDHRQKHTLESYAQDYLKRGKRSSGIVKAEMSNHYAYEVEDYAKEDALLLRDLEDEFWPELEDQDLLRVAQLEDDCIYATADMMRTGALLDEEKLDLWVKECEEQYCQSLLDLKEAAGRHINPGNIQDLTWLFEKLSIPLPIEREPRHKRYGEVTFGKTYLAAIPNPTIALVRRSKRLFSMNAKFLLPYKKELQKHGKLYYALHQLRAEHEGAAAGTISGRYSSSSFRSPLPDGTRIEDGKNIQQVAGKKLAHSVKEEKDWHFFPRELFIAPKGRKCLSGDADQIEYRIFAHYARPPAIMKAYAENPKTNFHKAVHEMINQYKQITLELAKDSNFAGLFGAGCDKFSFMIGLSEKEGKPLYDLYHQTLPEAKRIYKFCMQLAEKRGFIKTLLGRRARFPYGSIISSALNRAVQGSAADENKTKVRELRRNRKKIDFKMRFTVHDEAFGDVPNDVEAQKVSDVLNLQILKTAVPLYWTVATGPNWNACKKV